MRKILLVFTAIFALANENLSQNELKQLNLYEQILEGLEAKDISKFVEYLAKDRLPRRLDEMVVVSSLSVDGLTIRAKFKVNDTPTAAVSKFSPTQLGKLREEFIANGKNVLCNEVVSRAMMARGVKFAGSYFLDGRHIFDIQMDEKICE